MKKQLSVDEAYDRLVEEIEVVSDCVEGHVEDAAYWWSKLTGSKAEISGDTLRVVIPPYVVRQVIASMLEERLDDANDNPKQLAALWNLVSPQVAEVNYAGLLIEDDE